MEMEEDFLSIVKENLGGEELGPFDLDRITLPSQKDTNFRVMDENGNDTPVPEIEGIIIYYKHAKTYWEGDFSGEGSPPDCHSSDLINGIGDPGGPCKDCPNNEFGTKGYGKSCKDSRILYILGEDDLFPSLLVLRAFIA